MSAWSLTLMKGARDRVAEEAVLDAVLLNAMAEAFGLSERVEVALLPGESPQADPLPARDLLLALFRGECDTLCADADGRIRAAAPLPRLLVPGAFNPIHAGHWGLAEIGARLTGLAPAFELSVSNVDKRPLGVEELRRRLSQFAWQAPVWLVRAPTFVEKARLFPGATFVVGVDTAERIVAQRYYGNTAEAMAAALDEIRCRGCRFLVAGRAGADGRFAELHHLEVPESHRDLFTAVPASAFRTDVSSTALRAQGGLSRRTGQG